MMDPNVNSMSGMWMFGMFFMFIFVFFIWYLIIQSPNRSANRINASDSNYSNSVASLPPIVEPVRTRQSTPVYEPKSKNQDLGEFQYCTTCGSQNTLDATFCKSCGTKLL
ncbi:MAG: hypothetical protein HeimC2_24340 [Candidatus Heimdallarchaeota archaeon LC_2]|nr:MAG: hypothetical protein HeimC2_24340 [Candidatus Heimdallarchaeota archaeon LC_2]